MALCSFVSSLPVLLLILLCFSGIIDTAAEWAKGAVSQSAYAIKDESTREQAFVKEGATHFPMDRYSKTSSDYVIEKVHLVQEMAIEDGKSRSLADAFPDDYTPVADPSSDSTPPPP